MASILNATTSSGLVTSADNSGSLQLATNNGTTAVTIDTSQRAAFVAGTAALPAITTTGDTNTGIFFPAADTIAFAEGGAESMRIDSSGNLLVGVTSAVNSERLNVTQSGQFPVMYANNTNATNAYGIRANLATYFFNQTSFLFDGIEFSNLRFRVYSDGGIANYSGNNVNLSDQREKKDIALASNYLDKICQIPVKTFLYINQTDTQKTLGVIAQDVQAIAPELINETDWSANADGSKMRLSIYQTDLQYALMKAIQELKAELDATKAEVQALKGVA